MRDFFLGIVEITLGMSLLILLMLLGLKSIGGRFTAKCRYILWTLVLIRLALPFSLGIFPDLIEVPVEPEPMPQMQDTVQAPNVTYASVTPQDTIPVQTQTTPVEIQEIPKPTPEPLSWEDISAYIPYLYLIGVVVFLTWNLLSYLIYTGRILRSARRASPDTQAIYEAVCRKKELHHPPVLMVSPDVNSPAAFGLLRRRIVLPEIEFTENGLAGTLSHEVTHCKRGDLYIKAVCLLARTLHWFNPFAHLAAFRCEMEMELSCDEEVLVGCDENTRAAYGEVMLDIIKRCRRSSGVLTTHFNPHKNAVKARFANILYGSGKQQGPWLIAVCLVLCLIAGAVVVCRVKTEPEENIPKTEPLPAGETAEIPLLYTPYAPETLQDLVIEEIKEADMTEILQEETLCGVRILLYLDENGLFFAAYEKEGQLYRFIRSGGVKPVSFGAVEYENILGTDGFSVYWSWTHMFRYYFTVENGEPVLFLTAYDSTTEADYDSDGVTEVICQTNTYVHIYDTADGILQNVVFDSDMIQPKPGEFYRYLSEKNWFEFDYKKDGDNTIYHRYGVVKNEILTLVTPETESISENSNTGIYTSMEDYVYQQIEQETKDVVLEEQDTQPSDPVTEDSTAFTRDDWIKYCLKTDFGFREPVNAAALSDTELETYMSDAYRAALGIYYLYHIDSDSMYGKRYWSSEMPVVTIDNMQYSQMFNPVFATLSEWETYIRGILSDELTDSLLTTNRFIDYEGELWGIMGSRGTDISKRTVGFSITSRTDTEIIYTAEVEIREIDPSVEEPDSVQYYDFTYSLTEDGWRWTDFHLYY